MSYWIFTNKGREISCPTVRQVTYLESHTDECVKKRDDFDCDIKEALSIQNVTSVHNTDNQPNWNRLAIGNMETDTRDGIGTTTRIRQLIMESNAVKKKST